MARTHFSGPLVTTNYGTVTQATSKSTAVTLNAAAGAITMHNASLAAGAEVAFSVVNSKCKATDVIVAMHSSGGTAGAYLVNAVAASDGGFGIVVSNVSAGALAEAIVISFVILGASA